jgi:DNA (cytosine-5)-methyltransferase 1
MRYLSVCSGIEAATAAWHPLGWTPVAFSEIEKFPSAVLAHHYPDVPNWGDMTRFKEWPDAAIDVLVGGTPCQSFSVAGLRKGLADPRGNLALTFLALAERYRPRWVVWENVPGVLSSDGGRDFGAFLGGLVELGYGFAYRVLDAQYFGVAQRRRRVFVVGCLGDWRSAAAVLLEPSSLRGDSAPSREKGERVAAIVRTPAPAGGEWPHDIAGTLDSHYGDKMGLEDQHIYNQRASRFVPSVCAFHPTQDPISSTDGTTHALGCGSSGGQASAAVAFDTTQITSKANRSNPKPGDPCHPLAAGAHAPAIAFGVDCENNAHRIDHATGPLEKGSPTGGGRPLPAIMQGMQVRRLTPRECERLQGFPDDYTLIPVGNRMAADGPRYKALGNSMAVPVMAWIGQRIQGVA